MFNLTYYNVGGKIKIIAKVFNLIGIIASLATGAYFIKASIDNVLKYGWAIGIGAIIGGVLASFIITSFIYGFGELISTNQNIDCKMDMLLNSKKGKEDKE